MTNRFFAAKTQQHLSPLLYAAFILLQTSCSLIRGPIIADKFSGLVEPTAEAGTDQVTVSFLGVSTLLIKDNSTSLLVDGFFSKPSRRSLVFSRIGPDVAKIKTGLERAGIDNLDAVLVVHSHFDHAMDVAEVAKQTGATIYGSQSTANIALGGALCENRIEIVPEENQRKEYKIGSFYVSFINSNHFPSPRSEQEQPKAKIPKTFRPPAHRKNYLSGEVYSLLIRHQQGNVLVHSSAGYIENALDKYKAHTVLLGIARLNTKPKPYSENYWDHVVKAVDPDRVFLIHWDDFTLPPTGKLRAIPSVPWGPSYSDIIRRLDKRGVREGPKVGLLPFAEPVRLFH